MNYQTHKKNNLKNILKDMSIMKKYRLQLLSHGEIFNSREDAMRYINNNFKRYALWAEPAIVYYENEDGELRMILTVGATQDPDHKRIYIMDDGELREIVNNSNNIVNEFADSVATISDDLQSTINAAGLVLDENNINDRVEYRPNINDDVIKNSTTLAEAIEAVSAYAQEVREFAEEAKKQDVVYKPLNAEHNVKVTITKPEEDADGKMTAYISADVKVSEDEYNMLQVNGNRLFVPTISGGETSSTTTVVDQDLNGGKTIKTSIKDNYFGLTADGNKITLSVGETKQTVTLPGVEIVKRMEYDEETNKLKIIYASGENGSEESFIEIEINDLFDITEFNEEIAIIQDKINQEIADRTSADDAINDAIDEVNDNISNIEQQIIATRTGAGLNTSNGSYESNQATNYIKTATSLNDADRILDGAIKANKNDIESLEILIDANTQSLSDTISDAKDDIVDIENTLANGIELRADENNPREFTLFVNGVPHGSVIIPEDKDKFLSSVEYDDANHTLIFIWNDDAQTTTRVPIDNLIDTYTSGNGINISDGKVSVALLDTENYLEFSEHGLLKTKGIEDAIDNAINAASQETSEQFDDVYRRLESKAEANNVYTKDEAKEKFQVKLHDSDTISINTNNTNETTANVKISNVANNVISSDSNGIYTQVKYNAATNTLTFNDRDIQLTSHTIVERGYYDSTNNEIVLVLKDSSSGSEETKEIRIPVSDILQDIIRVKDTTTVNLEMTGDGDKTLTAAVKIASPTQEEEPDPERRENAIREYDNGIFVSKYADQYNSYYTVNNATSIISVQKYLETLNANVINLNSAIQDLTQRVTNIESILGEIIGEGSASDFADYGKRITRLETMVGDYNDYQGDNDPTNDGWSI